MKVSATYLYDGFADFWGGDGDRWDDNKGCLFAYYGAFTTLRDLVDQWVDDFCMGGDCDSFPEEVTDGDIRQAIVDMLSPAGVADYNSGAVAECAAYYAKCNDVETPEDEEEKCGWFESPVAIILIECEEDDDNDD